MTVSRSVLLLAASLVGASVGQSTALPAPSAPVAAPVSTGFLSAPQVTGAIPISGGRLLLTQRGASAFSVLPDASQWLAAADRLETLKPLTAEPTARALLQKVRVEDLTDVAWDGVNTAFAVTSHGRTRLGDAPDARYRLSALRFDATGKLIGAEESPALLQGIVDNLPFLADAIRRTPARTGMNIEGLAWDPRGELLIGLRAPTITESTPRPKGGQEDAVVLRLRNPDALFGEVRSPAVLGDTVKLDLNGQGIRGMCWDPARKGVWLLSGLSADPGHPVSSPWGLWFWKGEGAPQAVKVPPGTGLTQPEAVCRLEGLGGPKLLLVEPGKTHSPYALIPLPD